MMQVNVKKRWYVFGFLALLLLPNLASLVNHGEGVLGENRTLKAPPELTFSKEFSGKFEEYYNDNFGLRSMLIGLNAKLKFYIFKTSAHPDKAKRGRDGFLFYNDPVDVYDSYSYKNRLSKQSLDSLLLNQKAIKQKLEDKGIEYIVGFFPNKHTIYDDKLPNAMQSQRISRKSLADQIMAHFESNNFDFIDVRRSLFDQKQKHKLYHLLDTHWNSMGAYFAYKALFEKTSDRLDIQPFALSSFDIEYVDNYSGDLAGMCGLNEIAFYSDIKPDFVLNETDLSFEKVTEGILYNGTITYNQNCKNDQTLLVFNDSYTNALKQFISLHFSKVIYVERRGVSIEAVDAFEPDVVMAFCVERYLYDMLSNAY